MTDYLSRPWEGQLTEDPAPRRPFGYWAAVVLAVVWALFQPVFAVVSVFASDVCEPDSTAYFCSGDGQAAAVWVGALTGPGALVVALIGAAASRWMRRRWPFLVLAAEVAGLLAIAAISSRVT